jgi:hypothetical protein
MDFSEIIKSEDVQKQIRNLTTSVGSVVYNEIYLYIWFICIYNIFLLFVVVLNLYLLITLIRINYKASRSKGVEV